MYQACLEQYQDKWVAMPAHQILKVYKEALTWSCVTCSIMCNMQVFSTSSHYLKIGSSLDYVLEAASDSGRSKGNLHFKNRGEGEEPWSAWSSSRVNWQPPLFDDVPQQVYLVIQVEVVRKQVIRFRKSDQLIIQKNLYLPKMYLAMCYWHAYFA